MRARAMLWARRNSLMTCSFMSEWTYPSVIFPTVKIGSNVTYNPEHSLSPSSLADCFLQVWCLPAQSLPSFLSCFSISLGLGKPPPQTYSPASFFICLFDFVNFLTICVCSSLSCFSLSCMSFKSSGCSFFIFYVLYEKCLFVSSHMNLFLFSGIFSPNYLYHRGQIIRVIFLLLLIDDSGRQFWCWQTTLWTQCLIIFPVSQSYNTLNKRIASLIIQRSSLVPYSVPFLPRDLCHERCFLPLSSPTDPGIYIPNAIFIRWNIRGFWSNSPCKEYDQRLNKCLPRPHQPCLRCPSTLLLFQSFHIFRDQQISCLLKETFLTAKHTLFSKFFNPSLLPSYGGILWEFKPQNVCMEVPVLQVTCWVTLKTWTLCPT